MTLPSIRSRPGLAPAKRAAIFAAVLFVAPAFSAFGEDAPVARIGDITISDQDIDFATTDLAGQFAQVPEDQRRAAVLNALIDIKLMAKEAEKAGVDKTAEFAARLQFLRDRALHNAWFQSRRSTRPAKRRSRHGTTRRFRQIPERKEVHARHILLKTKEEAEAVIKELDAGKDFGEIAKEKTKDPGGTDNGGDLGFFGQGQMVPEFETAAFALANGEYTKVPVQTQFGWHVIRREEDRVTPPPAYDDVKDQVRQIVLREKYLALIQAARKARRTSKFSIPN